MKIVILDDHPMNGAYYAQLLNINGFDDVVEFVDTDECYEFVSSQSEQCLFIIDYHILTSAKYKIENGVDLILRIKKMAPQSKFIIFTLVDSGFELYHIYKKANPNGIWYKGDITPANFVENIKRVIEGFKIYTPTVQQKFDAIERYKTFDDLDLEIMFYISKGYRNKDLPNIVYSSLSNINTRKSNIKIALDVEGKEDLILMERCRALNLE